MGQSLTLQGQLHVPLLLCQLSLEPPQVPLQVHLLDFPGALQLLHFRCRVTGASGTGCKAHVPWNPRGPCGSDSHLWGGSRSWRGQSHTVVCGLWLGPGAGGRTQISGLGGGRSLAGWHGLPHSPCICSPALGLRLWEVVAGPTRPRERQARDRASPRGPTVGPSPLGLSSIAEALLGGELGVEGAPCRACRARRALWASPASCTCCVCSCSASCWA